MFGITAFILLSQLTLTSCNPQKYLNVSMMPRADTLPREKSNGPNEVRGLKIFPQYMFRLEDGIADSTNAALPQYPNNIVQLVEKLVEDALDFYKKVLKLSQPVRKEGILLSRSCEYTLGTGVIYASVDPILSACPERCGAKTFCGPRIEVPSHMLHDCVEQYYVDQVLYLDPYDDDPYEDPVPVDADYILFVEILKGGQSLNSVVSENAFCQMDLTTYRPIAGYLAFDETELSVEQTSRSYERMLAEVKQSLAHMLGFSLNALGLSPTLNKYTYSKYPDTNEERLPWNRLQKQSPFVFLPIEEVFRNVSTYDGNKYLLSSPKLVSTARDYFACSSLTSVEMENFRDEDETIPGSHWNGRIFSQELMSMSLRSRRSDETPNLAMSKFTLAFFEDTGWYVPDYSAAEPMSFGYLAGCSFLEEQSCSRLAKYFPDFYCDGSFDQTCSSDRMSEVICHSEKLPGESSDISGNPYSDFCPIMGPSKTDCSTKLAKTLSSFSLYSDVSTRCVRLESETNQVLPCEQPKSEYGLCEVITCNPKYYYITDLDLNCTYDNEIVKTNFSDSCQVQLKCSPCSEVCADCSVFPNEKPRTAEPRRDIAAAFALKVPFFTLILSTFSTFLKQFV